MKKLNPDLSHSIAQLRFPLAALVVFAHANLLSFPMEGISSDYSIIQYPILFLSKIVFDPAVPLFFLISGLLFFWNVEEFENDTYKSKITKRLRTLLVPFLVWNIVYDIPWLMRELYHSVGGAETASVIGNFILNIWFWTNQLDRLPEFAMTTPIDPPLWFVRDLFVCMLLSKLFYKLLKKKVTCILFLLVFLGWWLSNQYQYIFPGISVPSIFFFSFGAYIGIWKIDILNLAKRYKLVVLGPFICLLLARIVTEHYEVIDGKLTLMNMNLLSSAYVLWSIPTFLMIADSLTRTKHLNVENLAVVSFTLYAAHWMILGTMKRIMIHTMSGTYSQGEMFLIQIALYIIPCFVAILIYQVIRRSYTLKLLFSGGR